MSDHVCSPVSRGGAGRVRAPGALIDSVATMLNEQDDTRATSHRSSANRRHALPRYDRGVRRRLLNFATYLSLALCVLTAALWARGLLTWGYDTAVWIGPLRKVAGQAQFNLSNSLFGIGVSHLSKRSPGPTSGWSFHSFRSTFADADAITEAFADLGGRRIAGIWWASHLGGLD